MKTNAKVFTETGTVAGAIGKGLLAGLAGTAAITASQMIEMALKAAATGLVYDAIDPDDD